MKMLVFIFYLLFVMNMSSCKYWDIRDDTKGGVGQGDESVDSYLKDLGITDQSKLKNLARIGLDSLDELFVQAEGRDDIDGIREGVALPENGFDSNLGAQELQKGDGFKSSGTGAEVNEQGTEQGNRDEDLDSRKHSVYDALVEKVRIYNARLANERNQFNETELSSNIPFDKISSSFYSEDKQDEIYAGLRYDTDFVEKLSKIFDKLLLKNSSSDALETYNNVLLVFRSLSSYPKGSLDLLNEGTLEKIKEQNTDVEIKNIIDTLDSLVKTKDELVDHFKNSIESLSDLNNEVEIIAELRDKFLRDGGNRYVKRIGALSELSMVIARLVNHLN
ncbi:hypothetical protein [Borrelia persica]|uniref:hypothetical protein n=1 Tax=Borrelia persica TaxID=44448 RepID=UPI000463FEF4|nr:hypothetical protein [Borrelia persica]